MVAKPTNAAQFVSSLLAVVRELTGRRPPPTWTHVDKIQFKLETGNRDAIDAADPCRGRQGWLRSDGDPPASVTLTLEGIKLLEPGPAGVKPP